MFLLICGALFFFSEIQAGAKLFLNRQFMDERWSKHRVVTCLDWSPQVTSIVLYNYKNVNLDVTFIVLLCWSTSNTSIIKTA